MIVGLPASLIQANAGDSIRQAMYQAQIAAGQVMGAIISCYFDQSMKPSLCKRIAFLHLKFKPIQKAPDFNIAMIARMTNDFSYEQLEELVKLSSQFALDYQEGVSVISMHHLDRALETIILGIELIIDERTVEAKHSTAIHESGHAVAGIYLCKKFIVYKATIIGRGKSNGCIIPIPRSESIGLSIGDCENHIVMLLSGGVAQQIFNLNPHVKDQNYADFLTRYNLREDLKIAYEYADLIIEHDTSKKYKNSDEILEKCYYKALEFITEHQNKIEIIANYLVVQETVYADQLYALCNIKRPLYDFEEDDIATWIYKKGQAEIQKAIDTFYTLLTF